MKMVWEKDSLYSMRDLEYQGGSAATKRLWDVDMKNRGWVGVIHPYNPIMRVSRTDAVVTVSLATEHYKDKEDWLEKLTDKHPNIIDMVPKSTKIYFNKNLSPVSARREGRVSDIKELNNLTDELGIGLGHQMLDVGSAIHRCIQVATSDSEMEWQRVALYLPDETPFHITKYCLPELVMGGLNTHLFDIASAELPYVEKLFWVAVKLTSNQWFNMLESEKLNRKDVENIQKVAAQLLGLDK